MKNFDNLIYTSYQAVSLRKFQKELFKIVFGTPFSIVAERERKASTGSDQSEVLQIKLPRNQCLIYDRRVNYVDKAVITFYECFNHHNKVVFKGAL